MSSLPWTRRTRGLLWAGLLTGVLTSGCLGSPRPTSEFLTLPRTANPATGEATRSRGASLGLGPVTVAPHLERRYLAYRIDASRVEFADSTQWAAPLDGMVSEYLLSRLAETLGSENLRAWPWPQRRAPEVQLDLHLEEFAVGPDGDATVAARWSVRDPGSGAGRAGGFWEETVPADGSSSSAQVAALGAALDALAEFLVQRVGDQGVG